MRTYCIFLFLFLTYLIITFYLIPVMIRNFEQIANVSKVASRLEDGQTVLIIIVRHFDFSFEDQDDSSANGT